MSRQTTIVIIILIILSFVTGLGLGLYIGGGAMGSGQSIKSGENTYQAGWEAAKKRLADSGFYPMTPTAMEIKNISGEVKAVDGNKITLKTRPLEPLADPTLDTRTIIIDDSTKIFLMEQRDMATVQKEMQEYQQKMQEQMKNPATAKPIDPPMAFIKKEIKVSDLKAGQQISVTSAINIKDAKEIKAIEITAQLMAAAPVMPAPQSGANIPNTSLPPTPAGQANQ